MISLCLLPLFVKLVNSETDGTHLIVCESEVVLETYSPLWEWTDVPSLIRCFAKCSLDEHCDTFAYNETTHLCKATVKAMVLSEGGSSLWFPYSCGNGITTQMMTAQITTTSTVAKNGNNTGGSTTQAPSTTLTDTVKDSAFNNETSEVLSDLGNTTNTDNVNASAFSNDTSEPLSNLGNANSTENTGNASKNVTDLGNANSTDNTGNTSKNVTDLGNANNTDNVTGPAFSNNTNEILSDLGNTTDTDNVNGTDLNDTMTTIDPVAEQMRKEAERKKKEAEEKRRKELARQAAERRRQKRKEFEERWKHEVPKTVKLNNNNLQKGYTMYIVHIFTSMVLYAGTGSYVTLQIRGEHGGVSIPCDPGPQGFKQGAIDVIKVHKPRVGKIVRMKLDVRMEGMAPSWHLKGVKLWVETFTGTKFRYVPYKANYERWIPPDTANEMFRVGTEYARLVFRRGKVFYRNAFD